MSDYAPFRGVALGGYDLRFPGPLGLFGRGLHKSSNIGLDACHDYFLFYTKIAFLAFAIHTTVTFNPIIGLVFRLGQCSVSFIVIRVAPLVVDEYRLQL